MANESQAGATLSVIVDRSSALMVRLHDGVDAIDLLRVGMRLNAVYGDLQTEEQPATRVLARACGELRRWLDGDGDPVPLAALATALYAISLSPLRDRLFRASRHTIIELADGPTCRVWDGSDGDEGPPVPQGAYRLSVGPAELEGVQ